MKVKKYQQNSAFTLVELMVVTAIMVILTTALVLDLASQRQKRDIKLAQSQLVSNLRKIQSYALSARILPNGQSAQYYVMKFDMTKPNQYTIQGIYNVTSSPAIMDLETINLPPNISIAASGGIVISRSLNPTAQTLHSTPACGIVSFAEPFGKIIFNDGCSGSGALQPTDDYYAKIINFQTNVACDASNGNPPNPPICSASTDSSMTLTLKAADASVPVKTVTVNSVTTAIIFN